MIIITVLQAYSYLYTQGKSFLQGNVSPLVRKVWNRSSDVKSTREGIFRGSIWGTSNGGPVTKIGHKTGIDLNFHYKQKNFRKSMYQGAPIRKVCL